MLFTGDEVKSSSLILIILDHNTEELLSKFKSKLSDKKHLVVFNKSDKKLPKKKYDSVVSARSGDGVQELKSKIFKSVQKDKESTKKTFIIRERHLACFRSALSSLNDCIKKISNENDVDVAAEDLRLVDPPLMSF